LVCAVVEIVTPNKMYFLLAIIPTVALAFKYYMAEPVVDEEAQRKARGLAYAQKCGVAHWDLKKRV
jgi:hypothetical protein